MRRRGSRIVDSRSELAVSSTRSLRSASLRPTDRMSAGDCAPLQILAASIQLPGCDDDLLLRVDQVVNRTGVAGAGHGLALRQRKFLLERSDFQKEDIAARPRSHGCRG